VIKAIKVACPVGISLGAQGPSRVEGGVRRRKGQVEMREELRAVLL